MPNKPDSTIENSFRVVQNTTNPFEQYEEPPEIKPEELEIHEETVLEKAAEDLKINLPEVNLPVGLKIVAVLTLIGGLGTLGNLFANIFNTATFDLRLYILQLIGGVLFVTVSYGILKRQNWATWLYALLVCIALFINWPLAILPSAIVLYMYLNRKYFYPSAFDRWYNHLVNIISNNGQ